MDNAAQRVDYGSKTGEVGHDKELSSKPAAMTHGGGTGDGAGPTSSSRSYPKGGKVSLTPDFTPIKKGKRTGTSWAVGGV